MTDQAAKLRAQMNGTAKKQAKTIAIVSGKGGVGKSNFAINFSLALIEQKKKVLLFDLDIGMGNIDILIGKTSRYSIVDLLDKNHSIYDMIESGPNTLYYLSGGRGLDQIFRLEKDQTNHFLKELETVFEDYDYIIFDMGAGVTNDSIQFILASDECIVLTTTEPTAITDAYSMMKHILKQKVLPLNLVINRASNQKNGMDIMNRITKAVQHFLKSPIYPLGVVPEDSAVRQAVMEQKPFLLHQPKSKASIAIQTIAKQFLGANDSTEKPSSSSFLTRLRKFLKER
ncbi:flagellar biosynthesis protein FlhG [Gracilibacillus halotolerans]|uniref:Flagellar biosynthesis protein FlhG n=1 Tax=Gracilibacillus halotolerans TaxID=74386 RepID=A0A841RHX2_9BACI|nr:MinD/ParA family protein [Gracilibacillus halotolerans]MBB6511457.1 flagellar biosynthesis protein FlhG [Gracilibacillus halotolerans]